MYDIQDLIFWLLVLSVLYALYVTHKKEHFLDDSGALIQLEANDDYPAMTYNTYENSRIPYKYGDNRYLDSYSSGYNWWPWYAGFGDDTVGSRSHDYESHGRHYYH